jgi:hypothetical protein
MARERGFARGRARDGLATVHDVGITIDEFLFDGYGTKALAWYLSLGADRALTDHFGTWFYGPWFQIVTAVAQSFHAATISTCVTR